jgi:hypothetical protein
MSEHALPPANFETLVNVLMQPAAMALGLATPEGQEPTVDLEQAQLMIDLLRLVRTKTAGSRTDEESAFIDQTLDGIQRAYVAIKQQQQSAE